MQEVEHAEAIADRTAGFWTNGLRNSQAFRYQVRRREGKGRPRWESISKS
jgi:hypothetical protein